MEEGIRWLMDFDRKPGRGPNLVFRPQGFLVVMLVGADEARAAASALMDAGYAEDELKLYTGEEILANYQRYVDDRTVPERLAGVVTDDVEGRDLYLSYAREGRSALWVWIPEEQSVQKALRILSDYPYLHSRYYGAHGMHDVHLS